MGFKRYQQFAQTINAGSVQFESGLQFAEMVYTGNVKWHKISVSEDGRPDIIAWKWLGDPLLWYAIALFNNIRDPINGFCVGDEIAIPVDFVASQDIEPYSYGGTS